MKRFLTVLLAVLTVSVLSVTAEDSFAGYHQADTAHFTFIFDKDGKAEAEQFARFADTAWQNVAAIYGMPQDKTKVFMTSNTDVINAFAMSDTFYMGMYTTPNNLVEFGFRTNWHELFFTHELVHIANMNFENRRPPVLEKLGSIVPLLELQLPGFALEGLTTVLETEITAGGRGRSPYWELYYKAPAMENNMVTYAEIGKSDIPPRGQIYVYGYLISRSIADRFGITALADIERNRGLYNKWEDAVYTVTGTTAENIYNDAKKALDKRYAQERLIPEGQILTPHGMNTSYYPKPAVQEDRTIIALTSINGNKAVVQYDPVTDTTEELFAAEFSSAEGFTATSNGTVVFTTTTTIAHKQPGVQQVTDLYTWTRENGITQLTSGTSYCQPSISRDGNRLVAAQLHNGRYRIVEISLADGKATVLLENTEKDYVQPQLSENGEMLTCLELNDHHAAVALCRMPSAAEPDAVTASYALVYNNVSTDAAPTQFFDPAYPSFNNGKVTFCSNERGRLEVFECDYDGTNLRPVVADPVGALWAWNDGERVYYSSYASTGYVVKLKPASEWGVVPDFEGPSKPGEIITFGNLENDYPDFAGYERQISEIIPRSDETKAAAAADIRTQTILADERIYIDLPHLQLVLPEIEVIPAENNDVYIGTGISFSGMNHMKQNNSRFVFTNFTATYLFGLNQINANALFTGMRGASEIVMNANRTVSATIDQYSMTESTGLTGVYTLPLYSTSNCFGSHDLTITAGTSVEAVRKDTKPFAMTANLPYYLMGQASLTASTAHSFYYDSTAVFADGGVTATFAWEPALSVSKFVYEADTTAGITYDALWYGVNLKGRWFDLPDAAAIPQNITTLNNTNISCLYPGRIIGDVSMGSYTDNFLTSLYVQKMVSFGTSSYGGTPANGTLLNYAIDPETYIGAEAGVLEGRTKVTAGMVIPYSALKEDNLKAVTFYATVKLDGFRKHFPDLGKALH